MKIDKITKISLKIIINSKHDLYVNLCTFIY